MSYYPGSRHCGSQGRLDINPHLDDVIHFQAGIDYESDILAVRCTISPRIGFCRNSIFTVSITSADFPMAIKVDFFLRFVPRHAIGRKTVIETDEQSVFVEIPPATTDQSL
jgi:hypothetical protein